MGTDSWLALIQRARADIWGVSVINSELCLRLEKTGVTQKTRGARKVQADSGVGLKEGARDRRDWDGHTDNTERYRQTEIQYSTELVLGSFHLPCSGRENAALKKNKARPEPLKTNIAQNPNNVTISSHNQSCKSQTTGPLGIKSSQLGSEQNWVCLDPTRKPGTVTK